MPEASKIAKITFPVRTENSQIQVKKEDLWHKVFNIALIWLGKSSPMD